MKKVILYSRSDSVSCRKARNWLSYNRIPFEEKRIYKGKFEADELKKILKLLPTGVDDLVSTRSKAYANLRVNLDELLLSEAIQLFINTPSLIKVPILVQENKVLVGFNEEIVRVFIPKKVRKKFIYDYYQNYINNDIVMAPPTRKVFKVL